MLGLKSKPQINSFLQFQPPFKVLNACIHGGDEEKKNPRNREVLKMKSQEKSEG